MDGFDPEEAALAVAEALRAMGTAERAAQEKRYLKSELEFYGVTVPELRRVVTAAVRGYPGWTGRALVAWAVALWGEPVHERRMAAVEILTLAAPRLGAGELAPWSGWSASRAPGRWWTGWRATSRRDRAPRSGVLAGHRPVGGGRGLLGAAVGAARAAARHPRRRPDLGGSPGTRNRCCEREFFIRKAIGWVLREISGRSGLGDVVDRS